MPHASQDGQETRAEERDIGKLERELLCHQVGRRSRQREVARRLGVPKKVEGGTELVQADEQRVERSVGKFESGQVSRRKENETG